jgi:hypothetical protein
MRLATKLLVLVLAKDYALLRTLPLSLLGSLSERNKMKLRLRWAEKYEVVREYPSFEVNSEDFPELELEMLQVYNASNITERSKALDALEYKMHQVQPEGGETIFELLGPYDDYDKSEVFTISDEVGAFKLTSEEE